MSGEERWSEKRGDRKREMAGKERWSEKRGGRKRKVTGKEDWSILLFYDTLVHA